MNKKINVLNDAIFIPGAEFLFIPLAAVVFMFIQNLYILSLSLIIVAILFIYKIRQEIKKGTQRWIIILGVVLSLIVYGFFSIVMYKFGLFFRGQVMI
jgi:hypothetical protein